MTLGASIDDLDALIAALTDARQALSMAELRGNPADALWEVEAKLRHIAERANMRAAIVRRAIDVLDRQRHIA